MNDEDTPAAPPEEHPQARAESRSSSREERELAEAILAALAYGTQQRGER